MTTSITTYLDAHLDEYLAILERLVNLDCGTRHKAGVDEAGAIVREVLESRDWSVRVHPQAEYGDFLEARRTGDGDTRVMLLGHLDTVYPTGTAAERPFRIENDTAQGPGVADMKSGLLTGIYAVDALLASGFRDFAEIVFFFNSEEEVGSPASTPIYTTLAQGMDAALVLESARANGAIVSARKGRGEFHVQVTGREAHAGVEPEKGANAILELAHQIQIISALNDPDRGTTVNVGVAHGGTATNVVPASAEAAVDVRVLEREIVKSLEQAIHSCAEQLMVAGTSVDIEGHITHAPMEKTPAIAYLVELAQACARSLGFEIQDTRSGGISDANPIAADGVPVLDGLGPVGGEIHSPREFTDLSSIVPRTALLAELIRAIADHRDELRRRR